MLEDGNVAFVSHKLLPKHLAELKESPSRTGWNRTGFSIVSLKESSVGGGAAGTVIIRWGPVGHSRYPSDRCPLPPVTVQTPGCSGGSSGPSRDQAGSCGRQLEHVQSSGAVSVVDGGRRSVRPPPPPRTRNSS